MKIFYYISGFFIGAITHGIKTEWKGILFGVISSLIIIYILSKLEKKLGVEG